MLPRHAGHRHDFSALVVTPEQVVVAEAQRTLAYLALFGYPVDTILVNRVLDDVAGIPQLRPWVHAQELQLMAIDRAFSPPAAAHRQPSVGGTDRHRLPEGGRPGPVR